MAGKIKNVLDNLSGQYINPELVQVLEESTAFDPCPKTYNNRGDMRQDNNRGDMGQDN